MIKKKDKDQQSSKIIIYFGDQWDDFWRRRQQIAFRLSQYDGIGLVFYIELPLTLVTFLRYKLGLTSAVVSAQCRHFLRQGPIFRINRKLYVHTPLLPFPIRLTGKLFHDINAFLGKLQIKIILKYLFKSSTIKDRIIWVSLPYLYNIYNESPFNFISFGLKCYDVSEDITMRPLFSSERKIEELQKIRKWDTELTTKADQVFVCSKIVFSKKQKLNQNTHLLPNGVDMNVFRFDAPKKRVPVELFNLPTPILSYVGGIFCSETDLKLLKYIASKRPHWNIILIGPADKRSKELLKECNNIHFLGPKHYEELAQYLAYSDVCLGIYKPIDGNKEGPSLKILIYLALGKPIVSTAAGGVELFPDLIFITDNYGEFLKQVENALNDNNTILKEKRVAAVRKYSWDSHVNELYDFLIKKNIS